MKTEYRNKLWYRKYQYRAKFILPGINRTYNCKTFLAFLKKIEKLIVDTTISGRQNWRLSNDPNYTSHFLAEINSIDLDAIDNYLTWCHNNKQQIIVRTEDNTASVFSNDLALLKTLEDISPSVKHLISYTIADASVPDGVKHFEREPKHQFRVYLKSARLEPNKITFHDDLKDFIQRYKGTQSEMFPSGSLRKWLERRGTGFSQWEHRFCFEHFYIEFDEPSTHALLALMFSDMISAHYKLEKRPV